MVGKQKVWKTTHAALRKKEFERGKCPWSMGLLMFPFSPCSSQLFLNSPKSPRGSKANGITFASVQFRTWLNQCLVKKRPGPFRACYPALWQKGRQLLQPAHSIRICALWPWIWERCARIDIILLEPRGLGNTWQTSENTGTAVLQRMPVGQRSCVCVCACACAWMGSLLFKNLWSEFFGYFRRPFFSPSDCSPPPQQSDILFAVEFDRLRWQ